MMFIETCKGALDWDDYHAVKIALRGTRYETVAKFGANRLGLILLSDDHAVELSSLSAEGHRLFVAQTTSNGRHFIQLDGKQVFVKPKH